MAEPQIQSLAWRGKLQNLTGRDMEVDESTAVENEECGQLED